MKKYTFILSVFIILLSSNLKSQFVVYEEDEGKTPYTDYQIFETHSTNLYLPETLFDFRILNTGDTIIDVRIHIDSVLNSDGDAEFCINDKCSHPVLQGFYYPFDGEHLYIQPGHLQPYANTCKFANRTEGIDKNMPVDYVLKFYQIDKTGKEVGIPLHVRCRYTSKTSAIDKLSTKGQQIIFPNPAKYFVIINNLEPDAETIVIRNIMGKSVKNIRLRDKREKRIDVSDLDRGIYIISVLSNSEIIKSGKLLIIK